MSHTEEHENEWAFLERLVPFQAALDNLAPKCAPDIAEALRSGDALALYLRKIAEHEGRTP